MFKISQSKEKFSVHVNLNSYVNLIGSLKCAHSENFEFSSQGCSEIPTDRQEFLTKIKEIRKDDY